MEQIKEKDEHESIVEYFQHLSDDEYLSFEIYEEKYKNEIIENTR